MSKQSNPTLVGAFTIGAVALLALAVMLFGGSEIFKTKRFYVTYFPDSVKGLRVGSNVVSGGVRIGQVSDITLLGDVETLKTLVQVTMQVNPESYHLTEDGRQIGDSIFERDKESLQRVIDHGLRARLDTESLLTGQLLLELNFHPDQPAVMRGTHPPYPEIPSIQTNLQRVMETLQKMANELKGNFDIVQFVKDLQDTASGLSALANNEDLKATLAGANEFVNSPETQALTKDLDATVLDLQATLSEARAMLEELGDDLDPVLKEAGPAMKELSGTLTAAQDMLWGAARQMDGDTQLTHELSQTMQELQRTLRSLRVFLDMIEQNPEAFLRGKPQ